MRTPTRVLGFLAVLALVLVASLGLGRWVGPDEDLASASGGDHGHAATDDSTTDEGGHDHGAALAGGLQMSEGGHALTLRETILEPGRREVAFTIEGGDGPVTDYDVVHEKELHLIVVRRDLTGFQHLHPERDADGTWRVPVDLEPGAWRVLADFQAAGGEPHVLGADLFVPGDFQPERVGGQDLADTVDGYDVNLGGSFTAGAESVVTATVSRDGEVVTDLEPYLGSTGHLVALRAGDLGYVHVHPEGGAFHTSFPSAGSYRLFLDFKHDGVVRTAAFTVQVDGAGHDHGSHDHGTDDHGTDDDGMDTDPAEEHPVQEEPSDGSSNQETEDGHSHDH
ncbi:hypothetical protein [Nocardioides sp. SYSU DS0663]|uniref:hypothetical protein n=1 Tax=Nocardioides sp. SYSU DS0663 TaxID=3416445 RepID=UPI003F4B69E7